MIRKLSRLLPVGVRVGPVLIPSILGLIVCGISALWMFWLKFMNSYSKICSIDAMGNRVFTEYAKMEPLTSFNWNFEFFDAFFICMGLLAVYFFIYHFMGAKSIYTMRRLKNPLELYVRCLIIPVTFIILGIALIYLMTFVYIKIYLFLVPEECLFPWWNKDIWRDLL